MKKFWILINTILLICFTLGFVVPAQASDNTSHNVSIEWYIDETYYGEGDDSVTDGRIGNLLGSTSLEVSNGTFDFTEYTKNPEGGNFYRMYGILPLIRVNGKYYLLSVKYVECLSDYDDYSNTIEVSNRDTDIVIRLGYNQVRTTANTKLDKIKVSVDGSANENLTEPNTYQAYQIFKVIKSSDVQEDVTTDETIGQPILPQDLGFSYYIEETSEWYNIIANLPEYFTLTPMAEEGVYSVTLTEGVDQTEATAIEIADILEQYASNKTSETIVSNTARLDIDPGYYLIISPINSNLILATTNIDITEKALYPTIEKQVADQDENAQVGSKVHFTSTISIPKGSKAEMIITDKMATSLKFDPSSLEMNYIINYNFQELSDGFKITIPAETIKAIAAEDNVELILSYEAELTKDAVVEPRDDSTIDGNVNEIKLKYVNFIQTDRVDVDTTQIKIWKYDAKDTNKTPIAGAKFRLKDDKNNVINLYEIKPNEEYRVATSTDATSMTDITTASNKQLVIWGLDADITYKLYEIKAPNGYNALSQPLSIQPTDDLGTIIEIPNSKGQLLPSTGGAGSTAFYVLGIGILLVGSGLVIKDKYYTK